MGIATRPVPRWLPSEPWPATPAALERPAHRSDGLPHRRAPDPRCPRPPAGGGVAGVQPDAAPAAGPASLRQRRAAAEADRRPRHAGGAAGRWRRARRALGSADETLVAIGPGRRHGAGLGSRPLVRPGAGLGGRRPRPAGDPRRRPADLPQGLDRPEEPQPEHQRADEHRRDRCRADRPVAGSGDGQRAVRHRRTDRGEVPGSRAQRHPRSAATGSGTGHGAGRRRMEGVAGQASGAWKPPCA